MTRTRLIANALGGCFALLLCADTSFAAAMQSDKATDDSVCDLAPRTSQLVSTRIFVPAAAPIKEQVTAYFRAAASFVVKNCKQGQILILHGDPALDYENMLVSELSNSACVAASVVRTDSSYTYFGRSRPGYELRCPISKVPALRERLAALEAAEPLTVLEARMRSSGATTNSNSPSGSSAPSSRDCSKVSMASILLGGPCN